jgi:small GTP-binding protein
LIATGSQTAVIKLWNSDTGQIECEIEGHTSSDIDHLSFSADGKYLASGNLLSNEFKITKSDDLEGWDGASQISVSVGGILFAPTACCCSSLSTTARDVLVWDLDLETAFRHQRSVKRLTYVSAKIVLVGESNVGKSCLATRLAEDRYPEAHEQGTTHGMRFWPMEAEKLHVAAKPPKGHRRDVVLWDFGGQYEYQLVHQMFLHDTMLALVLIDPTRGRAALDEAWDWNKRLEKHLGKDRVVKLLVGTKVDKKHDLIDSNSIKALCEECGFAAFLDVSAKTGRNAQRLRKLMSDALAWDQMAKTSRPELFQRIRDDIEARRNSKQIVLTRDAFKKAIKRSATKLYDEAAIDAVCDQLATQGIVVRTKLTGGDDVLVLQLPVIERYAGSLIIAARNNPRGVPVLEERLLGSTKSIPLPGMTKKERLKRDEERTVLECVVELMIQHGICFRHGGLLVFPTLFPVGIAEDDKLEHSVSLFYDFTGAIDNIYASLVARLMVGEEFGEGRLWSSRVEFDRPGDGMCGIRQVKRKGGFAHVDLFFADDTPVGRRDLFIRFVEEHLRLNGVEIREHQAIRCQCGKLIEEADVQANIAAGQKDVICPRCRTKTLISEGVAKIRERDPESDESILALRKKIEARTAADVVSAKRAVASADEPIPLGEPIRILHLSDLHFEQDTSTTASLRWLLQDLRAHDVNYPPIEKVEYLVLSGDVTHRGDNAGFDKARQFVLELVQELGLDALRCVFVPGNHDIQRRDSCYRFQSNVTGLKSQHFVQKADIFLVRDESDYPNRLKQFSDAFYHKITSTEDYPLAPEQQGFSYFFEDTGVQFLALNTAWEIDQFFPKRRRSMVGCCMSPDYRLYQAA